MLKKSIKKFDSIYVETKTMMEQLKSRGLDNIILMSNFKKLNILNLNEINTSFRNPYNLCTCSRVMKEKGIEEAINVTINVISKINNDNGFIKCSLDIYRG